MGRRQPHSEVLRTFATRVARGLFLESLKLGDIDHPILATEVRLIAMAKSKLQEHLLATMGAEEMLRSRPDIESQIRRIAKGWIRRQAADGYDLSDTLKKIDESAFEDLFQIPTSPIVN